LLISNGFSTLCSATQPHHLKRTLRITNRHAGFKTDYRQRHDSK
jgi:hypothetical protein